MIKMGKKKFLVGFIVLIALLGLFYLVFVSLNRNGSIIGPNGSGFFGIFNNSEDKSNEDKTEEISAVCDSSYISKFNTYSTAQSTEDDPEFYDIDYANLEILGRQVRLEDGYSDDPTCQDILFWVAVSKNSEPEATAAYRALIDLREKGKISSSDLNVAPDLSDYQNYIDPLDDSGEESDVDRG